MTPAPQKRPHSVPLMVALAPALALAFAVVGCGSDDGSSGAQIDELDLTMQPVKHV